MLPVVLPKGSRLSLKFCLKQLWLWIWDSKHWWPCRAESRWIWQTCHLTEVNEWTRAIYSTYENEVIYVNARLQTWDSHAGDSIRMSLKLAYLHFFLDIPDSSGRLMAMFPWKIIRLGENLKVLRDLWEGIEPKGLINAALTQLPVINVFPSDEKAKEVNVFLVSLMIWLCRMPSLRITMTLPAK